MIFETALNDDLMVVNPVDRVKMSKITPKSKERKFVPATLDKDEILTLLGLVHDVRSLKMPVNLAVFTAVREGEVLALRWRNAFLEKRTVYIEENLQRHIFSEITTGMPAVAHSPLVAFCLWVFRYPPNKCSNWQIDPIGSADYTRYQLRLVVGAFFPQTPTRRQEKV